MSGWEGLVVLGLWAWLLVDLHLLRRDTFHYLRLVDQKRVVQVRELELEVAALKRKSAL